MSGKSADHKVEFENLSEGSLEVRYFDDHKNFSYRCWKLPKSVAEELISWWKKLSKNKNIHFPIKEKTKICEFNMYTEKYLDIREIDSLGRPKLIDFSLPRTTVEKLIGWHESRNVKGEDACSRKARNCE